MDLLNDSDDEEDLNEVIGKDTSVDLGEMGLVIEYVETRNFEERMEDKKFHAAIAHAIEEENEEKKEKEDEEEKEDDLLAIVLTDAEDEKVIQCMGDVELIDFINELVEEVIENPKRVRMSEVNDNRLKELFNQVNDRLLERGIFKSLQNELPFETRTPCSFQVTPIAITPLEEV
jgi:negative regulator of genetic competence, sporulation and motility